MVTVIYIQIKMEITDRVLLNTYNLGFSDELKGVDNSSSFEDKLLAKAYILGQSDAIVGDDVMSLNYQSNEQILNRIKS
jgi:hypothetical protein